MRLKLAELLEDSVSEYKIQDKVTKDGYIYLGIRKVMYSLPATGILAQRLLEKLLNAKGYR